MATAAGDLVVTLATNTTRFTAGLQKSQAEFQTFVGQVKSGLASLAGLVGLAAGGAGLGIGIKLAADAEQVEVAFATMLGSAEKARQVLGELQRFAAATPFQLPGIQQAARTLLAFSFSTEQLLPTMRMLGDVSAGTGKDLAELAVIYGQIRAAGKLMGGDLLQLINAGVPILSTLAKQFGKTEGEIKKMVESGRIGFADVEKAFQSMTSEGGLFAGMTEAQSKTLAGLWSTAKDAVEASLRQIGQAIVQHADLKGLVAGFTRFVEFLTGPLTTAITAVIKFFADWGRTIATVIGILALIQVKVWALVAAKKALAIASAMVQALAGPAGWAKIAIGLGIAAAAAADISRRFHDMTEAARETGAAVAEAGAAAETGVIQLSEHIASPKNVDDLRKGLAELLSGQGPGSGLTEAGNELVGEMFASAGKAQLSAKQQEVEQWRSVLTDLAQLRGLSAEQRDAGMDFAAEQIGKISGVADKVAKARQELELLNGTKTKVDVEIDEAIAAGALPEHVFELQQALEELDQARLGKELGEHFRKLGDEIRKLKGEIDDAGLALEEWARKGASPEQLAELDRLLGEQKRAKEDAKLGEDANRLFEATRTPLEKFNDEMAKLEELRDRGFIDDELFARGVAKAQGELDKAQKESPVAGVAALQRGSAEAFSAIQAAIRGGQNDPQKKTEKNTADTAKGVDAMHDVLLNIDQHLQDWEFETVSIG